MFNVNHNIVGTQFTADLQETIIP